jgi:phage recombination protein Bet
MNDGKFYPIPACKKPTPSEPVRTTEEIAKERDAYNGRVAGFVQPGEPAVLLGEVRPVTQSDPVTVLPHGYSAPKTYTSDEMILLRNVIAKGCTEPEFKLMMYMAAQYGLDPLLKQIWAVKRNEKSAAIIFVGRDGMLAIAHRSGKFDGMNSGVTYTTDKDGKEHPVTAWCEIWRKDMTHSFKSEVRFDEYVQPVPISGYQGLWQTKPSVMLIKCVESVCLRKAFSVSGLYSPEEIGDPQ